MEGVERTRFQGVWNIIRFNRHFYLIALLGIILFIIGSLLIQEYTLLLRLGALFIFIPLVISLLVSYYVYDLSGLYKLDWLNDIITKQGAAIVNINAGFDETSHRIVERFRPSHFSALDFYNPETHTELSIKRAREAGLVYQNTISFSTDCIPLDDRSIDYALLVFSLHEIRNEQERIAFLRLLKKKLQPDGKIIVVEHLRDLPNFIAYTIGFVHFYSLTSWRKVFKQANILLTDTAKLNPFIRIFVLE